ncbi:Bardet-Biedl syndrome 4 protein homolog [Neocloeon triangulifer]|uniref:Bardet-Biedl syndrome 4 protein homolog n=1 Tax=Neocloeon triangulifer TaxID=2078957 RepID=UPI00286EE7C6|nr:Bardet-Biedl syndrome 4 protein homolog [Neocloeon triangulifer]
MEAEPVTKPYRKGVVHSFDSYNWLIHLMYARKESQQCKVLIGKQLLASRGMAYFPNMMQGIILRQEGKMQESLDFFQACQIFNPGHLENLKQIAKSWLLAGRHDAALETYVDIEQALQKADWEIYHNIGVCLFYMKQYAKAKEYLKKAIEVGNQSESYLVLKNIYLMENDLDAALQLFSAAEKSNSDAGSGLTLSLGLLLAKARQSNAALEKLSLETKNGAALLAAGCILQERNDVSGAMARYKVAANLMPESAALWNNVGMCFLKRQKYVAAVCCLKRANYLAPFDNKILYNLGLIHLVMQQYASSFHFLSAWVHQSPYRGKTFMLLAVVLWHLGAVEAAKILFEQAARIETTDPLVVLNLAIFVHNTTKDGEIISANLREFQERMQNLQGTVKDDELLRAAHFLSERQPESKILEQEMII